LKHILGKDITFNDLGDTDPNLAKNLQWMLENDIDDIGLDFTYETEVLGQIITKELVPDGKNIPLNNSNKKEYVRRVCEMKMTLEAQEQIQAFVKGFRTALPLAFVSHFSTSELELLISGIQQVDLSLLRKYCEYEGGYRKDTPVIIWTWEILEEFSPEELSQFFYFLTGIALNLILQL